RLVPLRTPAQLWRDYWQPAHPDLAGVCWPGPLGRLAAVEPPPGGPRYVPLSAQLCRSHRSAALTALALVQAVRPRARPFAGRVPLLADGAPAAELAPGVRSGTFANVFLESLSPLYRPFALPAGDDPRALAAVRDVTCVVGDPARLVPFLTRLLAAAGRP